MLIFHKLRWRNFLSTGNNFTEIDLNDCPTTIMIGESGSGKSTFLDAMSFALFNKPYRNINKPQLINAINDKHCLVEVEFSIGNKEYLVRRGLKPNIFEIFTDCERRDDGRLCEGTLINQESHNKDYQLYLEKQILKFNYKSFCQIIVLGASNFTPFMELKPPDRRAIIEELLDIEIFSIMHNILKEKMVLLRDESMQIENTIFLVKEKMVLHESYLKSLSKDKQTKTKENLNLIKQNKEKIEEIFNSISARIVEMDSLEKSLSFLPEVKSQIQKLITIESKLEDQIIKVDEEIEFYTNHDDCPTCHQAIEKSFKEEEIQKNRSKRVLLEDGVSDSKDRLIKLNRKVDKASEIKLKIGNLRDENTKDNATADALRKYNQKLMEEVSSLKEEIKIGDHGALDQLSNELKELNRSKENVVIQRSVHELANTLLKDGGVKAKIIKQYLPLINKYTNRFLNAMNFFVTFSIDEEFNESIKSRGRDDFAYANFSEGEKQRIDLALLFTWRTIAKMKNSINTNLLIMDEVLDSYLDTAATENVLQVLTSDMFKDTNLFVISHKETITDKFNTNIRFTKKKNFSIIEKQENRNE